VTNLVVLDNTVLSNFGRVRRADVVEQVWRGKLATTEAAYAEYRTGVALGVLPAGAWTSLPVVGLTEEEETLAASLPGRLGPGERSCLAVAVRRGAELATDDGRARAVGLQHGVALSGTIGALVVAVRSGHLSEVEAGALLAEMIALGYHSPVATLDEALGRGGGHYSC
jgi:predicted nucleic acid-binding protein